MLEYAVSSVRESKAAFCRYISANDTKANNSHQAGFLISKRAWPLFFDEPVERGENIKKTIRVNWQNSFSLDNCFTYYGKIKNEFRLTQFGRNFPFFEEQFAGDLLILTKMENGEYRGIILSSDEDIEGFLATFNLSSNETNQIIEFTQPKSSDDLLEDEFTNFASTLEAFPTTMVMSDFARKIYNKVHHITTDIQLAVKSDDIILGWIDAEYQLFRIIERRMDSLCRPQNLNTDELVEYANSLLNRRKSRAGKSLEHHLSEIFRVSELKFEEQVTTENNEKPDFIFPGSKEYFETIFPVDGLTMLASKTTCKDRWRQVLKEADRIDHKYLFTLQQGISGNQLKDMKKSNLTLVVPNKYKKTFDATYHDNIETLSSFISKVKEKQNKFKNYLFL